MHTPPRHSREKPMAKSDAAASVAALGEKIQIDKDRFQANLKIKWNKVCPIGRHDGKSHYSAVLFASLCRCGTSKANISIYSVVLQLGFWKISDRKSPLTCTACFQRLTQKSWGYVIGGKPLFRLERSFKPENDWIFSNRLQTSK